MNRRFFLKGAGGLALAAPFLPSLTERTARAAAAIPRRNVIFHAPCGRLTNRWFPKVENGPLDAAALAGTTIEALTPYLSKLLVPRGLRSLNAYGVTQPIDPHDQAMGSKLTCAPIDTTNKRYATSFSLDHEIARQINPAGRGPLVLSVGAYGDVGIGGPTNAKNLLSYSAPSTPNPALGNPAAIYAGLMQAGSGQLSYLQRRRLSVIDVVRDDLQSLQRLKMSGSDTRRIDAWLELLRSTEAKLQASLCGSVGGVDAASVSAASPSIMQSQAFTAGADMMFKLMALSMLCDLNRSIVIGFNGYVAFNWDGINHENHDHDGLAHRTGDFSVGGTCFPNVLTMLAEIDTWYGAKFAKLVGLLDSLPEGEGTLLDNTATVWLQEFSDGGAFNLNNLPVLIAGSAGGYLKQGVAVNLEGAAIGPGNSEASCMPGGSGQLGAYTGSTGGNVPINKLYVTLMNAVGCKAAGGGPVNSFGVFDGTIVADGIKNPGELTALKA